MAVRRQMTESERHPRLLFELLGSWPVVDPDRIAILNETDWGLPIEMVHLNLIHES